LSLWNDLGLEDNPYDPKPLHITEKDRKLFIGRKENFAEFGTRVSSENGGIIIVEGGIGVGKTSFVNAFQYDCWKKKNILPTFESVQLEKDHNTVQFMLSVFSSMIHSLEKVDETGRLNRSSVHNDAKALIAKTIQSGWGGNISVLGSGVGGSRSKVISDPVAVVLPTIINLMDKWINFVKGQSFSSVIVPIDNLDILEGKDIIEFLNRMRDYLSGRPSIWWVLISKQGLFSLLEGQAHRVSEIIIGSPITIKPLSLKEVHEMIQTRIKNLTIKEKVIPPVPKEIVDILYDTSKGEARYILKRCSDIIYKHISQFPTEKIIPLGIAKKMLTDMAKQKLEDSNLLDLEITRLKIMAKKDKFQLKEYKQFKQKNAQALQWTVNKFIKLGLVIREDTSGKAVFYRTTGDMNLLFSNIKS